MTRLIAIDGGTTNTRLMLLEDGEITDSLSLSVGAGANAKAAGTLQNAVREAIGNLLERNGLKEENIERILASGMLTSELGLYTVPHLTAPVSLADLKSGMREVRLDLSSIPFLFAAGVKTEGEDLSELDMMRGEECELVGLFDGIPASAAVLLPGSHSKIILTDEQARIVGIKTMLTGEMLAVLSGETLLRGSFSLSEARLLPEVLEEGFLYADTHGLGDALFKVRVLKLRRDYTPDMLYSFFLGAVLRDEVKAVLNMHPKSIYVGGKAQLRLPLMLLLAPRTDAVLTALDDALVKQSTAKGLLKLYTL